MSSLEEQLQVMQQQIVTFQAQLQGTTNMPMQSADDTATLPLHSMGDRPHYDWSPSESLTELMDLDPLLHTSEPLSDAVRKTIIESYPPMTHLDYKAPATIPTAERAMNKGQRYEDSSLKQLQYQLSAVYRPLDILIHELVSSETSNPNLEVIVQCFGTCANSYYMSAPPLRIPAITLLFVLSTLVIEQDLYIGLPAELYNFNVNFVI
ncbi:hypothetical protein BD408DRAFT_433838 [Parasitella parasitica]|nr:hypothetical protein BD408DRAFT_433838 [Parasitella parasitica]